MSLQRILLIPIFILCIGVISAQEEENFELGLPQYQIGLSLDYVMPYGFLEKFIEKRSFGIGLSFDMRLTENSPLLVGLEYSYFGYDKRKIKKHQLSSVNYNVDVGPSMNDFRLFVKYEIASQYYVIPFVKAGMGLRYYNSSITEYDPQGGGEISTYAANKSFGFVGQVGAGVGVPIISPIILELAANYSISSPVTYDYLNQEPSGVQAYPLDFYAFNKSSMEYLIFELRLIFEFDE